MTARDLRARAVSRLIDAAATLRAAYERRQGREPAARLCRVEDRLCGLERTMQATMATRTQTLTTLTAELATLRQAVAQLQRRRDAETVVAALTHPRRVGGGSS